ncbi:MAG TPA: tannase/feruloyl esterase family alpha/beta hydrolase [Trinickia sp.]|uniref:tannase/feruloyl esterase family alpha/beta hydrolase n=1 Tax=Trinickia sp. TaxID=2571163 RepID=UPI002F42E898
MKDLSVPSTRGARLRAIACAVGVTGAGIATLAGCGSSSNSASPQVSSNQQLQCDDSLKTAFKPDANTTVTLVKSFKKGDDLNLNGTASGQIAKNDMCVVKLNIGPGNVGPASAPSTSPGIGIEIWLPSKTNWGGRIHVLGGGGYAGAPSVSSLTALAGATGTLTSGEGPAADIAGVEGAVSALTDTGHISQQGDFGGVFDGSWAMNPDGTINRTVWTDFASRAIHEMAVETKALAAAYYGQQPKHAYWDGCSTGGRQGLMEAQANPDDFDGILAGSAAINWTRMQTGGLYPEIVMQRDLGGVPLTSAQLNLVSAAAVSACDSSLTGQHDGFVNDPASCRYDPTRDATVLCTASGGSNGTAACLTTAQAQAVNKMWYGETTDGSAASPAVANGYSDTLQANQLWFGFPRGSSLDTFAAASANGVGVANGLTATPVALELQNPSIATPAFTNATGNGQNGWMNLSYSDLSNAFAQGLALQPSFANINTDDPDLSAFRARNGKIITYHGMADSIIMPQGSIHYYTNVANTMGGFSSVQQFYRFFEIPAMGHCGGIGSVNGTTGISPVANPPLPAPNQLYNALVSWVEGGVAPDQIPLQNQGATMTRPICMYPSKLTYKGGNTNAASSYTCS